MRVAPRIQRASIPHRLMPFFSRITRRRNFGPRAESARAAAAATRRIANNTFSLSRGLGLPRLLRPATEAIKLYSQRNQLWEKERKEERERERERFPAREKRSVTDRRETKRDSHRQTGKEYRATFKIRQTRQYRRQRMARQDTLFVAPFISRRVNSATIYSLASATGIQEKNPRGDNHSGFFPTSD